MLYLQTTDINKTIQTMQTMRIWKVHISVLRLSVSVCEIWAMRKQKILPPFDTSLEFNIKQLKSTCCYPIAKPLTSFRLKCKAIVLCTRDFWHFSGNLKINNHEYSGNLIHYEFYSVHVLSLDSILLLAFSFMCLTIWNFIFCCLPSFERQKHLLFSSYLPLVQSQKLLPLTLSILVRSLCNWIILLRLVSKLGIWAHASSCWCLNWNLSIIFKRQLALGPIFSVELFDAYIFLSNFHPHPHRSCAIDILRRHELHITKFNPDFSKYSMKLIF